MTGPRRGVYPGSFDPPTVAHLAIARRALEVHTLERVVLAVSEVALDKGQPSRPRFEDRLRVLRAEVETHGWLEVIVTTHQLVADIAAGYDVVIMGADKWEQIHDPRYYADTASMTRALASLPPPAIAPRAGISVPAGFLLDVPAAVSHVSSTSARAGALDSMSAAARRFNRLTGAWTDAARYDQWVDDQTSR
ncbi:MAG: hypothetical protein ACR2QE_11300 [Acidimicrobiales bacterium]